MAWVQRFVAGALLASAVVMGPAQAAPIVAAAPSVLFSQAPIDGGDAYEANFVDDDGVQMADGFTVAPATTVTGFRWWGTDLDDDDLEEFDVALFGNDGGVPSTSPAFSLAGTITKTATALRDSNNDAVYAYEITLSQAQTLGGTWYFSVAYGDDDALWGWMQSNPAGESYFRNDEGDDWQREPPDLAFAVLGDRPVVVPEPSSILLLGLALTVLATLNAQRLARRRR
jgi:PEP-CTERM motif